MIRRRALLGTAAAAVASRARAQSMTEGPIATTSYGRVRGATDNDIHVFKGIPYGGTTAGAARFRAPVPPTAWVGVRDTVAFPPMRRTNGFSA